MLHYLIMVVLIVVLFGEWIPFTKLLWERVGIRIKKVGEWFIDTYENKLYKTKEDWIEANTKKIKLKNFFTKVIFFAIATLVVIFLEIFWELGFKGVSNKFKQTSIAHLFEQKVKTLNKYVVLALFGIPFIFMEVLGLVAVGFIASGNIYIGLGLYVFKVLFFIPVHFVLHVGEDKLMSIPWFKKRYDIVLSVLAWFKRSQTYTRVHNFSENIGSYIRGFKSLFSTQVVNMKKAFEGENLLSEECEAIRVEINNKTRPLKSDFQRFLDCVNSHIDELNKSKEVTNDRKYKK